METLVTRRSPAGCGGCWSARTCTSPPRRRWCSSSRSSRVAGRHDARPGRVRGRGARAGAGRPRRCSRTAPARVAAARLRHRRRAVRRIIAATCTANAPTCRATRRHPGEHGCSRCSPTSRRSSRRSTNRGRARERTAAQPAGAPLACLRSLDADARGCRRRSPTGSARALAHYGIESSTARPSSRRPAIGCTSPSSGRDGSPRRARDPRPAAAAAGELAGRAGDDFREALDRLAPRPRAATRSSRTSPATSGSAASTSRCIQRPERASTPRWSATSMRWPPVPAARTATAGRRARRLRAAAGADAHRTDEHREPELRRALLEVLARRFYRVRDLDAFTEETLDGQPFPLSRYAPRSGRAGISPPPIVELADLPAAARAFAGWAATVPAGDLGGRLSRTATPTPKSSRSGCARRCPSVRRCLPPSIASWSPSPARARPGHAAITPFTFRPAARRARRGQASCRHAPDAGQAAPPLRGSRSSASTGWRRPRTSTCSTASRARQPEGRAAVRPRRGARSHAGARRGRAGRRAARARAHARRALAGIRRFQSHRQPSRRLQWNRVLLHVRPLSSARPSEIRVAVARLATATAGLGIEMLLVQGRLRDGGRTRARAALHAPDRARRRRRGRRTRRRSRSSRSTSTAADAATQRRGRLYPSEIVKLLAPAHSDGVAADLPAGRFVEHDLDEAGRLVPVDRPPGEPGGPGRRRDPQRHRAPSRRGCGA